MSPGCARAPNVMISQKGLVRSDEYPTEPGWKPFDNLAWLEAENEKKEKQEYMEQRRELYENRYCMSSSLYVFQS